MKEQFCDYNISLRLKNLGFDEPCLAIFNSNHNLRFIKNKTGYPNGSKNSECPPNVLAPLFQQTIDWFRNKHGMIISPAYDHIRGNGNYLIWFYNVKMKCSDLWDLEYKSYEEAREQSIIKAIKILEENSNCYE